jgi:outer membrane lipoprotein
VTFIGKIDGYQNTRIGEYDYRLPKLSADVIYLWPEQRQVDVVPYPYGPWGPGPYGPYWGGYGRWGWW